MAEEQSETDSRHSVSERQDGDKREDEVLVFEGETLRHSPQLGRRFIKWLSDRRE